MLQRRIAEYLATVEDVIERRSLLAEALTPPEKIPSPVPAGVDPRAEAASMHELVASLVDTMDTPEAPAQHSKLQGHSEAHLAGQQRSDRENMSFEDDSKAEVRESEGGYRIDAGADDVSQSQDEVVEDLLHTSPLQLLQARYSLACLFLALFLSRTSRHTSC